MRTVPTTSKQSNPDVKRAVILFPRPAHRQLECGQFHAYKLCTTPADATSPIYKLSGQNVTQGPPSYVVAKTFLKGDALTVFEQSEIAHRNQTVPHFELSLDDVAEHVFPEKAGQIQNRYIQRNICYGRDNTVKEWVAQ
eukprot:13269953-Ditylum_brightwellii.AAC.1